MTKYYVDTCIWLNLFKKEQAKVQGQPVWKIAELFLKQHKEVLNISSFVIEEIESKIIQNPYHEQFFQECNFLDYSKEDLTLARQIESLEQYRISFFDCIHIVLAKKNNCILITRDEELLIRGEKYVSSFKPETFLY